MKKCKVRNGEAELVAERAMDQLVLMLKSHPLTGEFIDRDYQF